MSLVNLFTDYTACQLEKTMAYKVVLMDVPHLPPRTLKMI